MLKINSNEDFRKALESLPLQKQRLVGARFIANVLDLTNDKHIIQAQSIASKSDATAEELHEAYQEAHASYMHTNPDSTMAELDWAKQTEHFITKACMACLAPTYPEASTHDLAQRVSMYCQMARTCGSINHDGDYPSFTNTEELAKKEVNDQYRIAAEFLGDS
jgi:hypothetical protein